MSGIFNFGNNKDAEVAIEKPAKDPWYRVSTVKLLRTISIMAVLNSNSQMLASLINTKTSPLYLFGSNLLHTQPSLRRHQLLVICSGCVLRNLSRYCGWWIKIVSSFYLILHNPQAKKHPVIYVLFALNLVELVIWFACICSSQWAVGPFDNFMKDSTVFWESQVFYGKVWL